MIKKKKNINFYFLLISSLLATTARSYLYGVSVGQRRVLPSTTQIKSEDKEKEKEKKVRFEE